MLRLRGAIEGPAEPVAPARRGWLTIYAAVPPPADAEDPAALRVLVVADLLGRVAQWHGLRVSAHHGPARHFWPACAALNIHPSEEVARPPLPFDVQVAATGATGSDGGRHRLQAGPLRAGSAALSTLSGLGLDPLALRLALLRAHYRDLAGVTPDELADADGELREWRALVADWATFPSRPMDPRRAGEVAEALDDDLDTAAALRALQALARDREVPPGAKFETFAHADQVLGLDLARDVGR